MRQLSLLLVFAAACAPCSDEREKKSGARSVEPTRSKREQLELRLAERKIDRAKVYPKRADGSADCGTDVDCFIAYAERCEPAFFERDQRTPTLLMTEHVKARYRIEGLTGGLCRIDRAVLAADMEVTAEVREEMVKAKRPADEIESMRVEVEAKLRTRNPPRWSCALTRDSALELALDIAEETPIGGHFLDTCRQPTETDPWPADLVVSPVVSPVENPAATK